MAKQGADLLVDLDESLLTEDMVKAREHVMKDCWNTAAWLELLQFAQNAPLRQSRIILDAFLFHFPTSGRYYRFYIEQELDQKNYDRVEELIQKALEPCMDVELWNLYLRYVRIANHGQEDGSQELRKAFDIALDKIGLDPNSDIIWMGYIQFLKTQRTNTPFEESQKISAIRKVYQRALELPLLTLDQIWKDYDHWEHSLNRDLAREILSKIQQKFLNAKMAQRERRKALEGIVPTFLAKPPTMRSHEKYYEHRQVTLRKQLIEFELSNPQKLQPEDLFARIDFTFRQCLISLRHYPEIWYNYAMFHVEQKSFKTAASIFEQAFQTLPEDPLVCLMYAAHEESQKNVQGARRVYETFLTNTFDSLVAIEFVKFSRRSEGIVPSRKQMIEVLKHDQGTWHVVASAALLELQLNKEPETAARIFSFGMQRFGKEHEFVEAYIDFLWTQNDHNNMRVIIEQALKDIPAEKCKGIWQWLLKLQRATGDLASISSAELRYAQTFGEPSISIKHLIDRYAFAGLMTCTKRYLETVEGVVVKGKEESRPLWSLKPDLSKMRRFHPSMVAQKSRQKGPGAPYIQLPSFPLPPSVFDLLHKLPPAEGLFVKSEALVKMLRGLEVDELRALGADKVDMKKVKGHRPPPKDIYRKRQAKRVRV